MFSSIFGGGSKSAPPASPDEGSASSSQEQAQQTGREVVVLVLDGDEDRRKAGAPSWTEIFAEVEEQSFDDETYHFKAVRAYWKDITLTAEAGKHGRKDRPPYVFLRRGGPPVLPDIILVRSMVRGLRPESDFRALLMAFRVAGVPAVNSWESIFQFQERPWVHASLLDIVDEVGHDAFPLIPQALYPDAKDVAQFPPFEAPWVVKVGHAEAGYGKGRVFDAKALEDVGSLLALNANYATLEPLVGDDERVYDIRLQKIGEHLRAYERRSANWKGNVGTALVEEVEVTEEYERWLALGSSIFGGLDICTVDGIRKADGSAVILEVNDTASGFMVDNEAEDRRHCAQLVATKYAQVLSHRQLQRQRRQAMITAQTEE